MTDEPKNPENNQGNFFDRQFSGYKTRLSNLVEFSFSGRLPGSGNGFTGLYSYSGWIFTLSIVLFILALLKGNYIPESTRTGFWQLTGLNIVLLLLLRRRGFFVFSSISLISAMVYLFFD